MTKAAKQTASGKVHPNHSKSPEDKQAKEMARKAKRAVAIEAKNKALQEAKDNGMTWDDTIPGQRFVDDYDAAYKAATTGGPALPEAEVKGDAGFAEAVLPKKGMIAEAVDKAKADAKAVVEKPTKSAQESAELFAAADKTTGKVDGLKVFAEFTGDLLEQEATKAVIEAICGMNEKPLSKSQLKKAARKAAQQKAARRAAQRAAQKAVKAEKAAARKAAKETNVETTDVTPSIEATASATESATAANQNEPENKGTEVPVSESQPETVASTSADEQPVVADASSDLAPGTKLPWHKRDNVKLLPPPKRPTQEEINAASTEQAPQELRNKDGSQTESVSTTADSTVDTAPTGNRQVVAERTTVVEDDKQPQPVEEPTKATVVEATVGTVAKPTLTLVPPSTAKEFYGSFYNDTRASLLDAALNALNLAIRYEREGKANVMGRSLALAVKKEAEAYALSAMSMKKAA